MNSNVKKVYDQTPFLTPILYSVWDQDLYWNTISWWLPTKAEVQLSYPWNGEYTLPIIKLWNKFTQPKVLQQILTEILRCKVRVRNYIIHSTQDKVTVAKTKKQHISLSNSRRRLANADAIADVKSKIIVSRWQKIAT